MRYGFETVPGRIDTPLPMAYQLPKEFQRAFQTVERRRLVRIFIDGNVAPPLFTEVEVTWPSSMNVFLAKAVNYTSAKLSKSFATIARLLWSRAEKMLNVFVEYEPSS